MRRRWRNFAHAILPTQKSFFHVSWNSIPTICWPRCTCTVRSSTNKLRPTRRGKPSRSSRKSDEPRIARINGLSPSSIRVIRGFFFCTASVENARERSAQEFSFRRNLRDRDGRSCCRVARARFQGHRGGPKGLPADVDLPSREGDCADARLSCGEHPGGCGRGSDWQRDDARQSRSGGRAKPKTTLSVVARGAQEFFPARAPQSRSHRNTRQNNDYRFACVDNGKSWS